MKSQSTGQEIYNFKLSDSDYTILDYKKDWDWMFKNARPTELSQKELSEIETIIEFAVKENNDQQKVKLEKHNQGLPSTVRKRTGFEITLDSMKRQYVPIMNVKGEKEVWINLFCDAAGFDTWKYTLMLAEDGGNCFFNLKVNLQTKSYYDLRINDAE